jgi:hypothetical protein
VTRARARRRSGLDGLLVRLRSSAEQAVERARAGGHGPVLAVAAAEVDAAWDPAGVAFAARRPDEPLWVLEQPARGGLAMAGLGRVAELTAEGPDRFARLAAAWRRVAGVAVGEGLTAFTGFAFAPDGAAAPEWDGFPAAAVTVPEALLVRGDGTVRLVVCARADPDDVPAWPSSGPPRSRCSTRRRSAASRSSPR